MGRGGGEGVSNKLHMEERRAEEWRGREREKRGSKESEAENIRRRGRRERGRIECA